MGGIWKARTMNQGREHRKKGLASELSHTTMSHLEQQRGQRSFTTTIECFMLDQGMCVYLAGNVEPLKSVQQKEWCVNVFYKSLNPLYSCLVLCCYGLLSMRHLFNPHHTLAERLSCPCIIKKETKAWTVSVFHHTSHKQ